MAIPERFKRYEQLGPVVECGTFGIMTEGDRVALLAVVDGPEDGKPITHTFVIEDNPEVYELLVQLIVQQWPALARYALSE